MKIQESSSPQPAPALQGPEYWAEIARQWDLLGAPLRPSAADVALYATAIQRWSAGNRPCRQLILGVTPELYRLPSSGGREILAVDREPAMIEAVWPGRRDEALCAEWTALPLPPASRDIVMSDGGLSFLPYPDGVRTLIAELRRVIAPGGLCIFRLYVPPKEPQTAAQVLDDLLAGRIGNTNVLKLRMWLAGCDDRRRGPTLGEVWNQIHAVAPDLRQLANRLGWSPEHLLAIDRYRDYPTHYFFPTLAEVRGLFCRDPGGFIWESTEYPNHEAGELCPVVTFRRAD